MIKVVPDKHSYKMNSSATHTLTISGPLDAHLAEHPLAIVVQLPNRQLTAHIHPAELSPARPTLKAVPLFQSDQPGIAGKIKLTVAYTKS